MPWCKTGSGGREVGRGGYNVGICTVVGDVNWTGETGKETGIEGPACGHSVPCQSRKERNICVA